MKIYHVIKIEEVETSVPVKELLTETGENKIIYAKENKEVNLGCFTSKALIDKFASNITRTSSAYEEYMVLKNINNNLKNVIGLCTSKMSILKGKIEEVNSFCSENIEVIINEIVLDILDWFNENNYICYGYNLKITEKEIGEIDQ